MGFIYSNIVSTCVPGCLMGFRKAVSLVGFIYSNTVFTCVPGESYCRRLRAL